MAYGEVASTPASVAPTKNSTLATPMLSEAEALTVTLAPDTDAPAAGAVRLTVGLVVSRRMVIVRGAEVALRPAGLNALAVRTYGPSGKPFVFHLYEYGARVSVLSSVAPA